MSSLYLGPHITTLEGLIVVGIGLIILWAIVSLPVWIAAKVVTLGRASFGEAMVATLAGPVVYLIVFLVVDFFLGAIFGAGSITWAYIFAFIAWVWAYKSSFKTGWLQGVAIAFLAIVVFGVLSAIVGSYFGATVPSGVFPRF